MAAARRARPGGRGRAAQPDRRAAAGAGRGGHPDGLFGAALVNRLRLVLLRHLPRRGDMDRGAVDRRERALHRLARASPAYRAAEGYHRMTRPILYHCPDARSLRCLWAAEEAGLAVGPRPLPFPPRAFAPDYRAINPLMTVQIGRASGRERGWQYV